MFKSVRKTGLGCCRECLLWRKGDSAFAELGRRVKKTYLSNIFYSSGPQYPCNSMLCLQIVRYNQEFPNLQKSVAFFPKQASRLPAHPDEDDTEAMEAGGWHKVDEGRKPLAMFDFHHVPRYLAKLPLLK